MNGKIVDYRILAFESESELAAVDCGVEDKKPPRGRAKR